MDKAMPIKFTASGGAEGMVSIIDNRVNERDWKRALATGNAG